ncbi:hypothetical protein [Candidatus Williamhamiltonella defendens]|nr:hypothetical protein [Candidatus Hamiltonella defensa]
MDNWDDQPEEPHWQYDAESVFFYACMHTCKYGGSGGASVRVAGIQ